MACNIQWCTFPFHWCCRPFHISKAMDYHGYCPCLLDVWHASWSGGRQVIAMQWCLGRQRWRERKEAVACWTGCLARGTHLGDVVGAKFKPKVLLHHSPPTTTPLHTPFSQQRWLSWLSLCITPRYSHCLLIPIFWYRLLAQRMMCLDAIRISFFNPPCLSILSCFHQKQTQHILLKLNPN